MEKLDSAAVRRGLFSKLRRPFEYLLDSFCSQIVAEWRKSHPSYQEFVLQEKLEKSRGDVRFLRKELQKAKEATYALERSVEEFDDRFAGILTQSDEQLREGLKFDVRQTENGERWEVVTAHCCLGGCDMGVYTFERERDALIFAALLTSIEYRAPHNITCSSCYAEYMQDCI